MPIKVTSQEMTTKYIEDIIEYYNYSRPAGSEPIEYLQCKGGGYKILCSNKQHYANGKYKQIRWQRKILISFYNYPSFSIEEELLLYNMMKFVLGKENVSYYLSYDQAIKHSPSFKSSILSSILACNTAFNQLPVFPLVSENDCELSYENNYSVEKTNLTNFIRRNTEPTNKAVGILSNIFTKQSNYIEKLSITKKQIIIDDSELSLSVTSGWKYPRIRI